MDGRQVTDEKALWDPPENMQPVRFDDDGSYPDGKSKREGGDEKGMKG